MRASPDGTRARSATAARGGFTLFELLVALTITGLIIGGTYAAVSTALDAAERNRAVERETHRDRNARMVLVGLLRSARVDLSADPEGFRALPASEAPSGQDELRFVSSLGFPFAGFPAQELLRARLWLEPGDVGARPLLLTLESLYDSAPRSESIALFDHLSGIAISYRGPADDAWRARWDSRVAVPASIRIQLEGARPRPHIIVHLAFGQRP